MKIGFYTKYKKGKKIRYVGDQMYAEYMCKSLNKIKGVSAKLYAPDDLPEEKLDFIIYLNDTAPIKNLAEKHILYMQNFYPQGFEKALELFEQLNYDGYMFASKKVFNLHKSNGFKGIYLPFATDTSLFYPRKKSKNFIFDVSYIGNDIKGTERSTKYLLPAINFNFALFGRWGPSKKQILKEILHFKNPFRRPEYQRVFMKICRGRISQEDSTVLYTNSKINLNCHGQDAIDQEIITGRVLDILACRGFLISDSSEAMKKELKGRCVFTEGGEDLIQKIKYYLNHPKERNKISKKGYAYVKKNHSMEGRAKTLYNYLKKLS